MDNFFKGLKVIELASVLAGPAVGMFFSELGAEVIKVENKTTGGDMTRSWKAEGELKERSYSAYFCAVNWNKKHLFLDLNVLEDKHEVYGLIKDADIVISNFKKNSAIKFGLDYDTIKAFKSNIIFGQIDAYPDGDERPAFDVILQAETSYLSMCGLSKGQYAKIPVALIDVITAHQLKEGLLLALLKRYKTGVGSYVSTSLYESAIASLANQATNYLMNDNIPEPLGLLHPNIAPYGELITCLDGKEVILAIGTDGQFFKLCSILDIPKIANNPRFSTNQNRISNQVELKAILAKKIGGISSFDFLTKCKTQNIPAGRFNNMKELFENESAKKMILENESEGNKQRRVRTVAVRVE